MQAISSHLLIRATQLTRDEIGDEYEFILNTQLSVQKWTPLKTKNAKATLDGMLFELKHVRVNPTLDNTGIISRLTDVLTEIGVTICNQPHKAAMAICFKPMGEIRDNVRFYLNKEGKLVFLSPITRPRLIYSKPKA